VYRIADGKLVRALVRRRAAAQILAGQSIPSDASIDFASIEEPLFSTDLAEGTLHKSPISTFLRALSPFFVVVVAIEEGLGARSMEWSCVNVTQGESKEPTALPLCLGLGDYSNKIRIFSDANLFSSPLALLQHHSTVINPGEEDVHF